MTLEQLIAAIQAERDLLIAVSTGGPKINSVNSHYQEQRADIVAELKRLGLEHSNRFVDLWAWYGKWSSGDLPTYQSRREYIIELFSPLLELLRQPSKAGPPSPPTGWARVDRGIDAVRDELASAAAEEQFQTVGLLCREALISLAQAVFDPLVHKTLDGVMASSTDAKRMLEAYIAVELQGGSNEAARKYARAALDLANELQHRRTATFRTASLSAEATTAVVNSIAIISGRRDSGAVVNSLSQPITQLRRTPKVGAEPFPNPHGESVRTRIQRVLALHSAERKILDGHFVRTTDGEPTRYSLPTKQGEFVLYFLKKEEQIGEFWYVAISGDPPPIEQLLADARVLMDSCSKGQNAACVMIIASASDLRDQEPNILATFERMKSFLPEAGRSLFTLAIWDGPRILSMERQLGIRVPG